MSESGDRNPKSVFELAGAVAVLLGLIFVGLELRQNTAAVQEIPIALTHAAERNPDRLSADTAGFLGCEKCDHLGYFLRCGNAARRI